MARTWQGESTPWRLEDAEPIRHLLRTQYRRTLRPVLFATRNEPGAASVGSCDRQYHVGNLHIHFQSITAASKIRVATPIRYGHGPATDRHVSRKCQGPASGCPFCTNSIRKLYGYRCSPSGYERPRIKPIDAGRPRLGITEVWTHPRNRPLRPQVS
jgi:hypothetical protein